MYFVCSFYNVVSVAAVVAVVVVLMFGKCRCLKVSFTTHRRIFFGVHFVCFGFVFVRSLFIS